MCTCFAEMMNESRVPANVFSNYCDPPPVKANADREVRRQLIFVGNNTMTTEGENFLMGLQNDWLYLFLYFFL